MKMDTNDKEILINRMFTGGYITSGNNLAHEVINLFKDDKGRNFVYVQAYGAVHNSHCNKDKNGDIKNKIETILLVKPSGKNIWEIIAKAEGLHPKTFIKKSWKKESASINKEQRKYIDQNSITYDGVPLYELYSKNEDNKNSIYYTFEADHVYKAKVPIYITPENNKDCETDNNLQILDNIPHFAKSSLKMYVNVNKSRKLTEIVEDKDKIYWGEETPCFKDIKINTDEKINFLKIIDREDDELIFSWLFKYVFEKRTHVTKKFFEQYGINLSEKFSIKREEGDIDLLLSDNDNVIVIENKIKSGINGKKDDRTQLDKYYEYVTRAINEDGEENEYYEKKTSCFIFVPNHNKIEIPETTYSKYYKSILYSEIYNFFQKYHYEYNNDIFFDQFFAALEKHTKNVDNTLQDDMYRMLAKHVEKLKND